ncbi:MAG: triose-phosphate isomerase [Alphaproteobacteria bacterium]|nr:triose-phosphate isomerase [Alphaproteobacteria bacterium]
MQEISSYAIEIKQNREVKIVTKRLMMGNWKMNGQDGRAAELLAEYSQADYDQQKVEAVLLVPYVYLAQAQSVLRGSAWGWGAQNCNEQLSGAQTGEISVGMLKDFDCQYVLVGHSERRQYFSENNSLLAAKYQLLLAQGLTPVLCVGESLLQRQSGCQEDVVAEQLHEVLKQISSELLPDNFIVAYEPVWAIGTGQTANVDQIGQMHALIREILSAYCTRQGQEIRLLYGGSVNRANAQDILAVENVDGSLIGGASLDSGQMIEIVNL